VGVIPPFCVSRADPENDFFLRGGGAVPMDASIFFGVFHISNNHTLLLLIHCLFSYIMKFHILRKNIHGIFPYIAIIHIL
jgi:hypothetical protein